MNLIAYLFGAQGADKREVPLGDEHGVVAEEVSGGGISYTPGEIGGDYGDSPFGIGPSDPPRIVLEPKEKFDRQPQTGRFFWKTAHDEKFFPEAMATPHLFYSVRMLYNHSVPPFLRVGKFKRRSGVAEWPVAYRIQASNELTTELIKRNDLESWMKEELADMQDNMRAYSFVCSPMLPDDVQYTVNDGLNTDEIREKLDDLGVDAERYVPTGKTKKIIDIAARRNNLRAVRKMKRMKRAVPCPSNLSCFPGKRCMEHRSYYGIRKPRTECNACKQVFSARKKKQKKFNDEALFTY